jgi:hypothetical protein
MRATPRRLRPCRPAPEALEGLAPVSSLVLGLPVPEAPAVDRLLSDPTRAGRARPRLQEAPSLTLASRADTPVPLSVAPSIAVAPLRPSTPSELATFALAASPARSLPDPSADPADPFATSVSLASASAPTRPAVPEFRSTASVTTPTSTSRPATSAILTNHAEDADGIRPMMLGPSTAGTTVTNGAEPIRISAGTGEGYGSASTSSGGGGTGSGSGGNPIISSSSLPLNETGNDDQGRHYDVGGTVPGKVPVGKIARFTIQPPNGNLTFSTITWAGGTEYSSYYKGPAEGDAPPNMKVNLAGPVKKNEATYAFIVDPDPRLYTITVDVTYVEGGNGSLDLSFTSVRPEVTELTAVKGDVKLVKYPNDPAIPDNGGAVAIRLDHLAEGVEPQPGDAVEKAGMHIAATTHTGAFDGQFMFLQIASIRRFTSRLDGNYHQTNRDGEVAIDNSFAFNSRPGGTGYPIIESDGLTDAQGAFYRWKSDANQTETHNMGDSPVTPIVNMNSKTLQVGRQTPPEPEAFDTYVMYKPTEDDSAVWVALAKVHWEWGAMFGNNVAGGVPLGGLPADWEAQDLPAGYVGDTIILKTLGPDHKAEYFPSWQDTTKAILGRGSNGWTSN